MSWCSTNTTTKNHNNLNVWVMTYPEMVRLAQQERPVKDSMG